MWEQMIGNALISEVGSVMYVGLSKAEKHVPYGELVGTTKFDVIDEVSYKPMSL